MDSDWVLSVGMFVLGTVFGLFLMWTHVPDIEKKAFECSWY